MTNVSRVTPDHVTFLRRMSSSVRGRSLYKSRSPIRNDMPLLSVSRTSFISTSV